MASLKHAFTAASHVALNLVFPPRCPSCQTAVDSEGNFCAACFSKVKLITPPCCTSCGVPFTIDLGEDAECPDCLAVPPAFTTARAAMVYDRTTAPLISALKFHDQWAGLSRAIDQMRTAGAEALAVCDVIVPVPLHWRRLFTRKYNQAAVLAYRLAQVSGKPCRTDLIRKLRATTPQMRLDRKTRLTNLRNAYGLTEIAPAAVRDRTLLLVDDVVTTGATANACATLLMKAGARAVHVLAMARTVKE